jgi:tetratricopeptide (TPR) repeat protein
MASIVPGYEYDIFISYRQKDNKGDRWVSEFVDALKTELESTFKEEISVYFDINPHDGLLETHDVNASLKQKLKCLIFIPIISQTYCDPQSFAWQHEFCTFNKLAKEDQFGRDIRLAGGNVASRILPIKIHELDAEDKTLLENELGGVLRSIDFIYKSTGVNRPLRANEDHPHDNLNKTYYRDQINKVANGIKEIITAIKKLNQQDREISKEVVKSKPERPINLKPKIFIASVILLALIILGYIFIPKLFKSSEPVEKSIAVLPFKLLSDEPDKQYLADGMMEAILLNLSKIKDLRVVSSTSVEQFRMTTKTARQIGKELGVEYLLEAYKIIKNPISESGEKFPDEWIGEDYIWIQEYDSAKIYFESALKSKEPSMLIPRFQADLSLAYFKSKSYEKARAIISQLQRKSSETIVGSPDYFIGWYYSGIDEVDSAILWLEKACINKSPELSWLKIDPVFNNLKKDPRYWDLYARTGHKAYDDYIAGMKKK